MTTTTATITRTAKGNAITWGDGRTTTVGATFRFVALYSTGGWNNATKANDLPTFSKHKTEAAAIKAARDHVAYSGGTYTITDTETL